MCWYSATTALRPSCKVFNQIPLISSSAENLQDFRFIQILFQASRKWGKVLIQLNSLSGNLKKIVHLVKLFFSRKTAFLFSKTAWQEIWENCSLGKASLRSSLCEGEIVGPQSYDKFMKKKNNFVWNKNLRKPIVFSHEESVHHYQRWLLIHPGWK